MWKLAAASLGYNTCPPGFDEDGDLDDGISGDGDSIGDFDDNFLPECRNVVKKIFFVIYFIMSSIQ